MCKKYRRIIGVEKGVKKKVTGKSKEWLNRNRVLGRPRIYDPEKISKELTEWSNLETSTNFVQFCADRGYTKEIIWRLDNQFEDFSYAYSIAKMKLAERRERFLNSEKLNYGAYNRYQAMYDPFLKKHETEEKDAAAARAKGVSQHEKANFIELAKLVACDKILQED